VIGAAPPAPTPLPTAPARRSTTAILVVLLAGALAFSLAQTMVIFALPVIARDYGVSTSTAAWTLTGSLVSASVATPIFGRLGDLYGKRPMMIVVLLILAAGSVLCALSRSIVPLLVGRAMCGIGAGTFALGFGIVRDTFPPDRLANGVGTLSAVFGIGTGVGLALSGPIVDHLDVSVIFWIGLLALPAAVGVRRFVPPSPTIPGVRIDWVGAALLSAALIALLIGVSRANAWGWLAPATVVLLAGGTALCAALGAYELRRRDPLIDVRVLRRRAVAATDAYAWLVGLVTFCCFVVIPQLAQTPLATGYGLGLSGTSAGLLLAPSAFGLLVMGPVTGVLGTRYGFRVVMGGGAVVTAAAALWMTAAHTEAWHLIAGGFVLGIGLGAAFASMIIVIVVAVPQSQVGVASGINTIMRTIGGAFGTALATAILGAGVAAGTWPHAGGYRGAFALAAAASLLAWAVAMLVPPSGRSRRARASP
jgi:MFS family permease